ncbi:hypothetical protein JG687_00012939 [Phytophthora cactorum]|uniref:Uncharacterized protein n=1 Tax=Phytophthora cactorum TaxID=29920 RepID=A0A8T1U2K7_9STRA|nr:hypothetical protein JG687_00012939 [Phytophthora cactorum]
MNRSTTTRSENGPRVKSSISARAEPSASTVAAGHTKSCCWMQSCHCWSVSRQVQSTSSCESGYSVAKTSRTVTFESRQNRWSTTEASVEVSSGSEVAAQIAQLGSDRRRDRRPVSRSSTRECTALSAEDEGTDVGGRSPCLRSRSLTVKPKKASFGNDLPEPSRS